ncbi:MAG: S-adenosylmethionine:tRNA ribosyltransferase-isomerase [Dysgonamonadaceae bacterium]|jgi:S-adenosylmethionine:tRNA ribosyltransferase-isomerase|nr:S-adenosylmethionine:tRNA ribosyltransferase-isomerase [Dysgonamonadaceae bacterium]
MSDKETEIPASIHYINIDEYDYSLPDERIAKFPLDERDKSKLLIYRNGSISESVFNRLPDFLPEKSLVVFNNTRVIRARLIFAKETGAQIEVFCLEPEEPRDYAMNFQSCGQCRWTCLVGNLKRWKSGTLKRTLIIDNTEIALTVERKQSHGHTHSILFRWESLTPADAGRQNDRQHRMNMKTPYTFAEILDAAGVLPIPPYLHRETVPSDAQTYQTVYSKVKGSVAAPTAGLHFTPEILETLDNKGFVREEVTLHVGAGTFKPVQTNTIGEHEMHTEFISVNRRTVANLLAHTGRITAVGTTSVRTLESLYYAGVALETNPGATPEMLSVKQWTPYRNEIPQISTENALKNIINYLDKNNLERLITSTQIIIVPGYKFHIVNNMITNFHQPQSTLLLLVSAFVKGDWKKIYDYALNHGFRFLSYGDSSFLTSEDSYTCAQPGQFRTEEYR